jgi:aspartate racemase
MVDVKTLGLIGGMSWESTTHYYQLLNRLARERLGGQHSAPLILWSVDFAPIVTMQSEGRWDEAAAILVDAARRLEAAGAEALLICANTMHRMADEVQAAVSVPLIHVADVTAGRIRAAGVRRPLLLATRYTMEQPFYRERLIANGVNALVPDETDRTELQRIIYDELVQGVFDPRSRARMLEIIDGAQSERGVDGVILGCTEFSLLLKPEDIPLPSFDTATIHVEAGMDFAMAEAS